MKTEEIQTAVVIENDEQQNQTPPQALIQIIQSGGIEQTKGQRLLQLFTPYFNRMAEIEMKIKSINADNPKPEDVKISHNIRIALKDNRVASEKIKDELKASILVEGRIIDNMNNIVKNTSKELEIKCENIEKFAEIQERKMKESRKIERIEKLQKYEVDISFIDLFNMPDAVFDTLLENSRVSFETRKENERKAEEERLAKIEAERKENERIRIENERLKAEREAAEKKAAEERKIAAEKQKAIEDKARKDKATAEEKLNVEREAKEKLEIELKAKKDAEERAKRDAELAVKKAAAAPDKDKLFVFSKSLLLIKVPQCVSLDANYICREISTRLEILSYYIKDEATKL